MRQKRGISNLVATVILVASAIAIAILIFVWISHSIKEETEKSADISTAEQVCRNIEISMDKITKTVKPNTVLVKVENKKDREITALRIRIETENEVEMKKIEGVISSYESKSFELSSTSINILSGTKIKIIPEIILQEPEIKYSEVGWWLCSDKAIEGVIE